MGLSGDKPEWGQGSGPGGIEGIHLGGRHDQLRLDPAAVDKSPGSESGADFSSVWGWIKGPGA